MKMKFLRCISIILCAATTILTTSSQIGLMNVQAEVDNENLNYEVVGDEELGRYHRYLSKDGKFYYFLDKEADTISIAGYNTEADTLTIPEKIDGIKVGQVGGLSDAFWFFSIKNNYVKHITFPQGITIMDSLAPNLESFSFAKKKSEESTNIDLVSNNENLKEVDMRLVSNLTLWIGAFNNCTKLKKIYLPKKISIGESAHSPYSSTAFQGCTSLTDVYYDGTEYEWSCSMRVNSYFGQDSSLSNAKKHFVAKEGIGGFYLGNNDKRKGYDYTSKLLSSPVKECDCIIHSTSIEGKTVKILDTVVLYDGGEPVKVTEVRGVRDENKKITTLIIGKNVTTIWGICENWSNLKKITINSTKLKKVNPSAFKGIHPNATIKVPAKKLAAYKKLLKGFKGKIIT